MVSFRLTDDEVSRVDRVIEEVLARNPHLLKANVYRELIGVIETGLITESERRFLRGELKPLEKTSARKLPPVNSKSKDKMEAS